MVNDTALYFEQFDNKTNLSREKIEITKTFDPDTWYYLQAGVIDTGVA